MFLRRSMAGAALALASLAPLAHADTLPALPESALLDPEGKVVAIARHHQIIKEHKSVTAWLARVVPPPV